MKFFKSIKHKVSKQITFGQGGAAEYTNPVREWAIGLFAAIGVFVLGAVFIAFDFYNQFLAPAQAIDMKEETEKYQVKDVLYYADVYKKREELFNQLREVVVEPEISTTSPDVEEPSIEVLNDTPTISTDDINTSVSSPNVPLAEQ